MGLLTGVLGDALGIDPRYQSKIDDALAYMAAATRYGGDPSAVLAQQQQRDMQQAQMADQRQTSDLQRRLLKGQADEMDNALAQKKAYAAAIDRATAKLTGGGLLSGGEAAAPTEPRGGLLGGGGYESMRDIRAQAGAPQQLPPAQPQQQAMPQAAPQQGGMAGMPLALQAQLMAAQEPGVDPAIASQALKMAVEWKNAQPKFSAQNIMGLDGNGRPVQYAVNDRGEAVALPFTPAEKLQTINAGNRMEQRGEYSGQLRGAPIGIGVSPDAQLSANTTMRGQNMTDAREREGMNKPQIVTTDQGVFAVNPRNPNGAMPVMGGGGQIGKPATGQKDALDALAILKKAEPIIKNATGSLVGRGYDMAANAFGFSTNGSEAAAQLKALEGAVISKMPKMSGPQSDKDVEMYRQMAGSIGDPTIPAAQKLAALQTIREIQARYAGYTDADIKHTALKNGQSVDEVKRNLGIM